MHCVFMKTEQFILFLHARTLFLSGCASNSRFVSWIDCFVQSLTGAMSELHNSLAFKFSGELLTFLSPYVRVLDLINTTT